MEGAICLGYYPHLALFCSFLLAFCYNFQIEAPLMFITLLFEDVIRMYLINCY